MGPLQYFLWASLVCTIHWKLLVLSLCHYDTLHYYYGCDHNTPEPILCHRDGRANCSQLTLWSLCCRDEEALEQFVWEVCQEMYKHYVYKAPWFVRHMSSTNTYVVYADGGRGTVAIILHDIGMCWELEWHHSRGLCMCLIDYTSGHRCRMLTWLLCYILSTLSVTCMMKLLFLSWIDHSKTCIIWSFTKLYSLCSSLNFFRWWPTRTRYWASSKRQTTRHITIVALFFSLLLDKLLACSYYLRYVQVLVP